MNLKNVINIGGCVMNPEDILESRRLYSNIIENIRMAMKDESLTIDGLANAVGVAKMTISNMLDYRVAASLETVVRCCAYLGIDFFVFRKIEKSDPHDELVYGMEDESA